MLRRVMMAVGGGSGGGDEHWALVRSLLHFEGPDGSTTVSDAAGAAWISVDGAKITAATCRFGASSLALPGSGAHILCSDDVRFAYGLGDFTWEAYLHLDAPVAGGANMYVLDHGSNGGVLFVAPGTNKIGYYTPATGVAGQLYSPPSSAAVISAGQWVHVACTRAVGVTRLFAGGFKVAEQPDSQNYTAKPLRIGRYGGTGYPSFVGKVDEVRITSGVARYTADFTPPSMAFPSAG